MRVLLLAVLFVNILFAKGFSIKEVDNLYEVIDKIKLSYEQDSITSRSYTPVHINEFEFDASRDQISSIYDANNTLLFYLVHNKVQNDPTLKFVLNYKVLNETTGYRCNYIGGDPICSAKTYYESVLYSSNTVAAWIKLKNYPTNDNQLVLLHRVNGEHDAFTEQINPNPSNPMQGRDHMKVYVGTDGKLTIRFALFNGHYTRIKTPLPIPLNTDVYIQANNSFISFKVGWKTLDNQSSIANGGHQYFSMPWDVEKHKRNINVSYTKNDLPYLIKINILDPIKTISEKTHMFQTYNIRNYYWDTKTDMFKDMNTTDLTNKLVYEQDRTLQLDLTFINKILTDIAKITDYFPLHKLRIFVDDNMRPIAVDVRESY